MASFRSGRVGPTVLLRQSPLQTARFRSAIAVLLHAASAGRSAWCKLLLAGKRAIIVSQSLARRLRQRLRAAARDSLRGQFAEWWCRLSRLACQACIIRASSAVQALLPRAGVAARALCRLPSGAACQVCTHQLQFVACHASTFIQSAGLKFGFQYWPETLKRFARKSTASSAHHPALTK